MSARTTTPSSETTPPEGAPERVHVAVAAAQSMHTLPVTLPYLGRVPLPSADELAFLAGIGVLAALGAVDWPVALVLGAGRVLSHVHRWRSLAAFGDALEHA